MAKKTTAKKLTLAQLRKTDAVTYTSDVSVPIIANTRWQQLDDMLTGSVGKTFDVKPGSGRGIPAGRIIEIVGPESSGKTTLALEIIAAAQKKNKCCAFIDFEHALDRKYAQRICNIRDPNLWFEAVPDTAEEGSKLICDLARTGEVDLIVVDSVAAMTPQAEMKDMQFDKNSTMGVHARLMSKLCRMLSAILAKTNCTVIFINQIRHKIGVMFGNPETTPGGNALKFYASIRLDIRKVGKPLLQGKKVCGHTARLRAIKNKIAPPQQELLLELKFGKGVVGVTSEDPNYKID